MGVFSTTDDFVIVSLGIFSSLIYHLPYETAADRDQPLLVNGYPARLLVASAKEKFTVWLKSYRDMHLKSVRRSNQLEFYLYFFLLNQLKLKNQVDENYHQYES